MSTRKDLHSKAITLMRNSKKFDKLDSHILVCIINHIYDGEFDFNDLQDLKNIINSTKGLNKSGIDKLKRIEENYNIEKTKLINDTNSTWALQTLIYGFENC